MSISIQGVKVNVEVPGKAQSVILTEPALAFIAALHRTFELTRQNLLRARLTTQHRLDAGAQLDFPAETKNIRDEPAWTCAPPAPGLEDRRVEITGPTDRKMVVNALNSGAKTFMADFEGNCHHLHGRLKRRTHYLFVDSNSPTFANMVNGQLNLYDAIRHQVDFEQGGKSYTLSQNPAVLIVR